MAPQLLDGTVALVTGAASGIGAATVRHVVSSGGRVLALDLDEDTLRTEHPDAGDSIEIAQGNVTDPESVATAVQRGINRWGQLNSVANVAGIFRADQTLENVKAPDIHRLFDVNVVGPTIVLQETLEHLRQTRGSVVNVTSMIADRPADPNAAYYAASKAALAQLTRCWAVELGSHGIRVNAVSPGPTDTPILSTAGLDDQQIHAMRHDAATRTPLARTCQPDDIAAWIVRLLEPGSFATGQTLTVDGGLNLV